MPFGLPPGLRLNPRTGDITGTIAIDETPQTWTFDLYIRDSGGFAEEITGIQIAVTPYTVPILETDLSNGGTIEGGTGPGFSAVLRITRGRAYEWPIRVKNLGLASGPFTWGIIGQRPTNINFQVVGDPADGLARLTGTSSQSANFNPISGNQDFLDRAFIADPIAGLYAPTVRVTDSQGVSANILLFIRYADSLQVSGQPPPVSQFGSLIWRPTVTGGFPVGTGSGMTPLYNYQVIGQLPPNVQFIEGSDQAAGQLLANSPQTPGTYNFTIRVRDRGDPSPNQVDHAVTYTVVFPLSLSGTLPSLAVETGAYSGSLQITGGAPPYTVMASGLPPGLGASVSGSTVLVSGTPSVTGASGNVPYGVSITVTDSQGIQTQGSYTITVRKRMTLATGYQGSWFVNSQYSSQPTINGGLLPITYALIGGSLPSGYSLNPTTGVISGTTATTGFSSFTVRATDAANLILDIQGTISIVQGMTISGSPPPAIIGSPYSFTFTRNGGSSNISAVLVGEFGELAYPPSGFVVVVVSGSPVLRYSDGIENVAGIPATNGPYRLMVTDNNTQQVVLSNVFNIVIQS